MKSRASEREGKVKEKGRGREGGKRDETQGERRRKRVSEERGDGAGRETGRKSKEGDRYMNRTRGNSDHGR